MGEKHFEKTCVRKNFGVSFCLALASAKNVHFGASLKIITNVF